MYFVDIPASYSKIDNGISKLYYYDFNTKQMVLIDEMERYETQDYGKFKGHTGIGLYAKNVGSNLNDEGVFYSKKIRPYVNIGKGGNGYKGYDEYDSGAEFYYVKKDEIMKLEDDSRANLSTIYGDKKTKYPVMNKSVGGVSSVSGFYIKDKFFEDARIIYVSNEGDHLICRETNGNCYKMNIDTYEKEDLNDDFDSYSIKYFDNHNLLYVSKNKDLKFNGNIIDYNVDYDYIDYNNSFNTFCYEASDGLTIYKDGVSTLIENDVDNGCLTNKGNVYYILNNELILYKNNEKQVIDSSENSYDLKTIKYKIIE